MAMQPRPMVTIAFQVPPAVFDGLQDLARRAGHPRDLYASNLLIAAYSARRGPTGDSALDEAVAWLNVKHSGQFNGNANAEVDRLRAELSKTVQESFKAAGELREERVRLRKECETLETLLNDEKIANARLISELHAAKQALEADQKRPTSVGKGAAQIITDTEIRFVSPKALPSADPGAGLPDCTRRMIVALNAAGLRPSEIARDTDTPLHVVKAVLETRRRRA